jgi:hypothetical protein
LHLLWRRIFTRQPNQAIKAILGTHHQRRTDSHAGEYRAMLHWMQREQRRKKPERLASIEVLQVPWNNRGDNRRYCQSRANFGIQGMTVSPHAIL